MVQHDDPPVATFRVLYSLLSWGGLIFITLVLIWLVWTLFATTSTGTARSEELAIVRPTVTAMAAEYADEDAGEGGVVKVDLPTTCAVCHLIEGTAAEGTVGPELSRVGGIAAERIGAALYTGNATTAEEYILESILDPSAYVVPGDTYGKPGASTMPAGVGNSISKRELNRLVAYLASLQ